MVCLFARNKRNSGSLWWLYCGLSGLSGEGEGIGDTNTFDSEAQPAIVVSVFTAHQKRESLAHRFPKRGSWDFSVSCSELCAGNGGRGMKSGLSSSEEGQ